MDNFETFITILALFQWIAVTSIPIMCGLFGVYLTTLIKHLNDLYEFNLKFLASIQIEIYETVQNFNVIVSYQMSTLISTNLMALTFGVYEVYNVVYYQITRVETVSFAIILTCGGIYFLILILIDIYFFHSACEEMEIFRSEMLMRKTRVISMQLDHVGIKFSTGLFVCDWKIIGSVRKLNFL